MKLTSSLKLMCYDRWFLLIAAGLTLPSALSLSPFALFSIVASSLKQKLNFIFKVNPQ